MAGLVVRRCLGRGCHVPATTGTPAGFAGTRSFAVLSHMWLGDATPERPNRVGVIMHGILGSKANWKTPSKHLLQRIGPRGWKLLLLTHRGHHESPSGEAPHTIASCSNDVLETLAAAGVDIDAKDLELVVCGHSFGGKVALMLTKTLVEAGKQPPLKTWLLDSIPGLPAELSEEEQRRQQSVSFVMRATEAVAAAGVFSSRSALVDSLCTEHGLVKPLAQWVAQSVQNVPGGVKLSYDMSVVRQIYCEYRDVSLFSHLEQGYADIGVVVAGQNRDGWGEDNLAHLQSAASAGKVQVELLEKAGHNIHVDDLPGLLDILERSFISAERA